MVTLLVTSVTHSSESKNRDSARGYKKFTLSTKRRIYTSSYNREVMKTIYATENFHYDVTRMDGKQGYPQIVMTILTVTRRVNVVRKFRNSNLEA